MILSSTRPANHARVESAGDSAGQLLNRVFERHRTQLARDDPARQGDTRAAGLTEHYGLLSTRKK